MRRSFQSGWGSIDSRGERVDSRITKASWFAYKNVCYFLDGAFVVSPSPEFTRFLEAQKQKFGSDFDLAESTAIYLERLAGRVASDDLDEGFSLPGEFRQLNPETWPTNNRPGFGEPLPQSPGEGPYLKTSRAFDIAVADSLPEMPSLPNVVVSLKQNLGSGATPGMWPVLTNNSPETFEGVVVEVRDIRRWDGEHRKWTTSGVEWSVFPDSHAQPKGTQQTVDRFLGEARRLGKAIEGCDLKRKFSKAVGDDPGDDWLNVVATFLSAEPRFTGSGRHFGRTHDTEWIMRAIDASKHTCALLASMAE